MNDEEYCGLNAAILKFTKFEREETSKIVLNEERSRMPLPPALQARLAKRGIIQKGKGSFKVAIKLRMVLR